MWNIYSATYSYTAEFSFIVLFVNKIVSSFVFVNFLGFWKFTNQVIKFAASFWIWTRCLQTFALVLLEMENKKFFLEFLSVLRVPKINFENAQQRVLRLGNLEIFFWVCLKRAQHSNKSLPIASHWNQLSKCKLELFSGKCKQVFHYGRLATDIYIYTSISSKVRNNCNSRQTR